MKIKEEIKYDFAIVGSGLGGLQCAYILAQEGYKVVIIEKNRQLGGSLQVFSRNKHIFDTGVHYIGGLDEGQNLNQFFKYFGIMQNIDFKKLDNDGFDQFKFKGDDKTYYHGQGFENFENILIKDFPDEQEAIKAYSKKIRDVVEDFPLYNLEPELNLDYYNSEYHRISAYEYIKSLTDNETLQNVLAGSNLLYGGSAGETPLYMHALIANSYIESAYRCVGGGSKIAVHLGKQIRHKNGKIITNNAVVSCNFNTETKEISSVKLAQGEEIKAEKFIFNIAPKEMIRLVGADKFKKAFVNRVNKQKPGISSFSLHLTVKDKSIKYPNYNLYYFDEKNVWDSINYEEKNWPTCALVCVPYSKSTTEFTQVISVLTYMKFEEVAAWKNSVKTDAIKNKRDKSYLEWKKEKEDKMIDFLEDIYPDIKSQIVNLESSTPLTYRDYIGNDHGAMYGIVKDYNNPLKSFMNARTRIPNLFLTGQYLNLHGVLGVTISAFITCFEFINKEKLLEKVKQAK